MKLVISLSFMGQCREAMQFYADVLGGQLLPFATYGDASPEPGMEFDPKYKDWIMNAWLEIGDQSIMAADLLPQFAPHVSQPKNGFDVSYHTEDQTEAKRVFDALSEGGQVRMPFAPTFWSPGYGNFIDRFGIPWMVNTLPSGT